MGSLAKHTRLLVNHWWMTQSGTQDFIHHSPAFYTEPHHRQMVEVYKFHTELTREKTHLSCTSLIRQDRLFSTFPIRQCRCYTRFSDARTSAQMEPQRNHPTQYQLDQPEIKPQKQYFYRRSLPPSCVSFSSDEGKKIFVEALLAGYMEGYYSLASQFRTQDEPAFCGLSTLVMVLNTLEVDPKRVWKGVWRWYHEHMLDCCVPLKIVAEKGITFEQFACLAACNSLNVQMIRGDNQLTEDRLREDIKIVTRSGDKVVAVSYSRKTFGQTGDGHFSPVGGYHPDKDLVLILDTARFKYPPHWVKLTTLCDAMRALDPVTGQPRGYMVLKKTEDYPPVLFHVSPLLSINSQFDSQKSDQGGVHAFLKQWNDWLAEKHDGQSETDTWQAAIGQFLKALEFLGSDFLLTTQGYLNCTISSEHTCAIRELLKNLEKHHLFSTTEEQLDLLKPSSNHINPSSSSYVVCDTLHCGTRDCQSCGFKLNLQARHFVTMLLLAWPYTKCGNTNSNMLAQSVSQALVNCHEVLQNEVNQLQKQLASVLGYMCEMCDNCQCRV